jgi:hypothetical protein
MKPRTPIEIMAYTIPRYPKTTFFEKTETT